jgi:hypothetical protein
LKGQGRQKISLSIIPYRAMILSYVQSKFRLLPPREAGAFLFPEKRLL